MSARVLILGFGNPGRCDDGLGPALAAELEARRIAGVSVETGYQLQVEDAVLVAEHDVVVFADAHRTCAAPFELRAIEPRPGATFTTHSVAPETVLALAHDCFGSRVAGYTLGIRGVEFDGFGERLSDRARAHLSAAADALEDLLRENRLPEGPVSSACERMAP